MVGRKEDNRLFTEKFKSLYERYAGELMFFARKFVDRQTAEDIVHNLFVKIWDKKLTVVADETARSYLLSMTRNACYDHLKHQTISDTFMGKAVHQLKMEELAYYSSSAEFLYPQRIEAVYHTIEALPPKSRDIFKRAYLDGEKHSAIAEEMNISVRTVETHIYKSLRFMRDKLISLLILACWFFTV